MSAPPSGPRSSVRSLGSLLASAPEFRVPRYQRAYSWGAGDVGQLIEDLFEALANDAPYYFMGSVVVIRDGALDAEIVDGQQRLATYLMMGGALGLRLAGRPIAAELARLVIAEQGVLPRVRLRPGDQATFATTVRAPDEAARIVVDRSLSDSQSAMLQVTRTIAEALDDVGGDRAALERFARFIIDRTQFNVLETDDRAGAPRLFMVINDTGADLSAADLVKAALFERCELDEEAAEDAARRWDALIAEMGRKDFDEMLAFMPAIVSGGSPSYPTKFGVLRRGLLDHVSPERFLKEDIHRYADALAAIRRADVDAGEYSGEVSRRIRCLLLLKSRQWIGPAVAAVAEHEGPRERLLLFFEGLERLAYACALSVVRAHTHTARFAEVLRFRAEPHRLFGPGGVLELTDREREDLVARLNRPFDETSLRRTMVMRANAALPDGEALALTADATTEHIMPRARTDYWDRAFPDPVWRRQHVDMLGNLTLLTGPQNRAAKDKPFPDKLHIYFNWKGAPMRAVTRTLRNVGEWNSDAVIERHETLVQHLANDWRL